MLRVGIIGAHLGGVRTAGSWGVRAHIPALRALPMFEVSAIANAHLASALETAERFAIPNACATPAELVAHPAVDIVAICVRVPEHRRLISLALEAGKHVYCEWPLGSTAIEAQQMTLDVVRAGVSAMIGLQGRRSPALAFVRDLIAAGELGAIRSVSLNHSVPWPTTIASSMAYLQTDASGANYFTIAGGHGLDLVQQIVGEITELSAIATTQIGEVTLRDVSARAARQTPDQIDVIGALARDGATFQARFQGASAFGTGITLEINGSKADLRITPVDAQANMIQIAALQIERTTALGTFEPLVVPARYWRVEETQASGPALNVAHAWLAYAEALEGGWPPSPNFSDALKVHRLLDTIRSASEARNWARPQLAETV